jgi:hypothetical protein
MILDGEVERMCHEAVLPDVWTLTYSNICLHDGFQRRCAV